MLAQLSFSGLDWLPILFAIAAAYIVFGIAGFGTALVAGPVLIHFMPLSRIIPLLVLLDFVAAFGNLLPSRRDVVRSELLRLLPFMALGCTLGVVFLLQLKSDLLLLLMGLFISAYAIYSLWVKARPAQLSAAWAVGAAAASPKPSTARVRASRVCMILSPCRSYEAALWARCDQSAARWQLEKIET